MDEAPELQMWTTADRRRVFENRWLSVELEQVTLPDGSRYEYTRLLPGGTGVAVMGFNDAGEVLLEREYRHGVREVIWQLPGGLSDDGENLQAAGLRELLEETGYRPRRVSGKTVRYLGAVWDNPALGPGESHIYAAWGLEKVAEPKRDSQEFVTLHWQTMDWLRGAVRSGEIRDRVVVAALLHLALAEWY
jgi:ADP-ribose pyrophosphatase